MLAFFLYKKTLLFDKMYFSNLAEVHPQMLNVVVELGCCVSLAQHVVNPKEKVVTNEGCGHHSTLVGIN